MALSTCIPAPLMEEREREERDKREQYLRTADRRLLKQMLEEILEMGQGTLLHASSHHRASRLL